jgi:hypothetical protein
MSSCAHICDQKIHRGILWDNSPSGPRQPETTEISERIIAHFVRITESVMINKTGVPEKDAHLSAQKLVNYN